MKPTIQSEKVESGEEVKSLLDYFSARYREGEKSSLPPLTELSKELGVSVASLREQLEVARAFGLVEVRPRTGITINDYSFRPAAARSFLYSVKLDQGYFTQLTGLWKSVEMSFIRPVLQKLSEDGISKITEIVNKANNKIHSTPAQIPHEEERSLHEYLFEKSGNQFVFGIVEAFWDTYEAVGLNIYTSYDWLEEKWGSYLAFANALARGDFSEGEIVWDKILQVFDTPHEKSMQINKSERQISNRIQFFAFAGSQEIILTPKYQAEVLSPYIVAIAEIQNSLNQITGQNTIPIKIRYISQLSPVSVSMDGASNVIQVIQEMVVPWRRKHIEIMARFQEQEKQAEIEIKKAEILERRATAEKDRTTAIKQREEAEKLRLENEKLRLEIQQAKINLALSIINKFAPNAAEEKKLSYLIKILPSLDVIVTSELNISL